MPLRNALVLRPILHKYESMHSRSDDELIPLRVPAVNFRFVFVWLEYGRFQVKRKAQDDSAECRDGGEGTVFPGRK